MGKDLKEVRLRAVTQDHDVNVKMAQIERFLEAGSKVRISISLRGRENVHANAALTLVKEIVKVFNDVAGSDYEPRIKGNMVDATLSPRVK